MLKNMRIMLVKYFLSIPLAVALLSFANILYATTDSTVAGTQLPTSSININSTSATPKVTPFGIGQTSLSYPYGTTTYPYETSMVGGTAVPAMDQFAGVYPSCPGDPSGGWPFIPICPNVNGKYPVGYEFMNVIGPLQSPSNPSMTQAQAFCPDYCTSTRVSSPAPPPIVTSFIAVTSFQTESCPVGYVSIADYNMQPAIQYIDASSTLVGPFTSQAAYDGYRNNPLYSCSVSYTTTNNANNAQTNTQVETSAITSFGPYNQPNVNVINHDGAAWSCSASQVAYQLGAMPSTPPSYYTDMLIQIPGGWSQANGNYAKASACPAGQSCIGQWIGNWTYSYFMRNWSCGTPFICGLWSYDAASSCNSGGSSDTWGGAQHKDIWWIFFRYERCKLAVPTSGWYYTPALEATSHVCARIRPVWQQTN